MPASTTVTGMVLSVLPVGEYDRRLVILTKEIGKISAFAKGARRPNSALLACGQPFVFGEFTLYTGRNSYNVLSAEVTNYFGELRENFEGICYACYFCEFADYLTRENNDEKEILRLLYQTLRALSKGTIDFALIKPVFELKIMTLSGEAPQVFDCVNCKKNSLAPQRMEPKSLTGKYYFSAESGGILCQACKGRDKAAVGINTSTLYTLQYIVSSDIEKLYTFRVTDEVLNELKLCLKNYMVCYIQHDFKSLEMLDGI